MKRSLDFEVSSDSAPASVSGRKHARPAEAIPTLEEARKRLAVFRARAKPWLAPIVVESPDDVPELIGPETYRKR